MNGHTEPSRAPEPLKPCPFCGELPTPYSWDSPLTGPNSEIVHCATVGCPASTHEKMERSNRAAWNRRSATPASPTGTGAIVCRDEAEAHVAVAEMFSGKFGNIQGVTVSTFALSPSSPREPSEAAHLSKHARDRLEEIAARAYRDDVAATVVLSPMEAYAILRAIDFPPSGGTT